MGRLRACLGLPPESAMIALAILTNLAAAALGGIFIPQLLGHFRIDPAVSSGAFVTTVTDVLGYASFLEDWTCREVSMRVPMTTTHDDMAFARAAAMIQRP